MQSGLIENKDARTAALDTAYRDCVVDRAAGLCVVARHRLAGVRSAAGLGREVCTRPPGPAVGWRWRGRLAVDRR